MQYSPFKIRKVFLIFSNKTQAHKSVPFLFKYTFQLYLTIQNKFHQHQFANLELNVHVKKNTYSTFF